MITGNKNDIAKLLPYVSERLGTALRYIAETDFTKVENGKYNPSLKLAMDIAHVLGKTVEEVFYYVPDPDDDEEDEED